MSILLDLPDINIGEITLIGTGGGYGESCIIHIGNHKWIVVDSCINPITRQSLPLEYLQNIGVNLKTDVVNIICTHWHDDHIQGISQLLQACESAKFRFAKAHDKAKFLYFIGLDSSKAKFRVSNASMHEFRACLNIIKERGKGGPHSAHANTLIIRNNLNEHIESSIFALSPSDYTLKNFDIEIGQLITDYGDFEQKIIYESPNMKSIALFVKLGNHRAILGSDLEVRDTDQEGWNHVIANKDVIDKKASLFKVAHHGSVTGFSESLWIELLDDKPLAKITPWNRKNKLPQIDMLSKLCLMTDQVYLTSDKIGKMKAKPRDRDLQKLIKKWNDSLYEVTYEQGVIRSRIDILDPTSKWDVAIDGSALHVNKHFA